MRPAQRDVLAHLGLAVLCAEPVVLRQSFVVALGDSIIGLHAQSQVVRQMIEHFERSEADGVVAALFVWVSLSSRRLWTVVVAAFQMLGVASHLATVIDHRVTINTYKLSLAVWSYGILLVLAVAGILLLKTSTHAEDEELHHIDTLSLSTLLVL